MFEEVYEVPEDLHETLGRLWTFRKKVKSHDMEQLKKKEVSQYFKLYRFLACKIILHDVKKSTFQIEKNYHVQLKKQNSFTIPQCFENLNE